MLLLIGRYNAYIYRGSDRQIEPLGPDVFDVVSDVLQIVRDIITIIVRLVDIQISLPKFYTRGFKDGKAFHCRQQGDFKRIWNGILKSTRLNSL